MSGCARLVLNVFIPASSSSHSDLNCQCRDELNVKMKGRSETAVEGIPGRMHPRSTQCGSKRMCLLFVTNVDSLRSLYSRWGGGLQSVGAHST